MPPNHLERAARSALAPLRGARQLLRDRAGDVVISAMIVIVGLGAVVLRGERDGDAWTVVFDGFGSVRTVTVDGREAHELAPAAAQRPDETHAALVVSTRSYGDLRMSLETRTTRQLRQGSPANPWEVAWVVWHYRDEAHFYYLVLKPNGWEVGKRHPSGAGGQLFLASGTTPTFQLGTWYRIEVVQVGSSTTIRVGGRPLVSLTDADSPYVRGRVGMYVEDAVAQFAGVQVREPTVRLAEEAPEPPG